MRSTHFRFLAAALLGVAFLALASCESDKKKTEKAESPPAPKSSSMTDVRSGEAGGVWEDTFSASATVDAIDPATRKITLASAYQFIASRLDDILSLGREVAREPQSDSDLGDATQMGIALVGSHG